MSFVSTLGSRSFAASTVSAPAGGAAAGVHSTAASGNIPARIPVVQPVSLQSDTVSLSKQGLAARNEDVTGTSVEAAQKFIAAYARQLLGKDAPGASTRFTGSSPLQTADGQDFTVDVEVRYQAPGIPQPDALALTGKPLPAIAFPGSLSDLFKVLGRELSTQNEGELPGTLTVRLLRLVDRAALLAPRAQPDALRAAAASYRDAASLED